MRKSRWRADAEMSLKIRLQKDRVGYRASCRLK